MTTTVTFRFERFQELIDSLDAEKVALLFSAARLGENDGEVISIFALPLGLGLEPGAVAEWVCAQVLAVDEGIEKDPLPSAGVPNLFLIAVRPVIRELLARGASVDAVQELAVVTVCIIGGLVSVTAEPETRQRYRRGKEFDHG